MGTEVKYTDNKARFISLCESVNRPGMTNLIKWLEDNDFYSAPASARYHGAYSGGLLDHSLNVYDELKRLLKAYPEIEAEVTDDSVIICSLFHDLCKVNMYSVEKRNRKNKQGQWESYDAYTIKEKFCYGGHGSKSVYLVQHFVELSPEEAVAIQCHMASWEEGGSRYVGNAFEQFPFAWLVHVADEAATFILEKEG